jgi:hypothetical protein
MSLQRSAKLALVLRLLHLAHLLSSVPVTVHPPPGCQSRAYRHRMQVIISRFRNDVGAQSLARVAWAELPAGLPSPAAGMSLRTLRVGFPQTSRRGGPRLRRCGLSRDERGAGPTRRWLSCSGQLTAGASSGASLWGRNNPCYVYHVVTVDDLLMHYTGGLPGELAGQ